MNIHHTIIKGAAKAGIVLTSDADTIAAHHMQSNTRVERESDDASNLGDDQTAFNEMARDVWNDCQSIVDYNADDADEANGTIKIRFEDGDFVGYHDGEELARDPVLEDLLVSLAEAAESATGNEPLEDDEPDDEDRGSVVPPKYKAIYAEAGHPTHCGDWLAETLNRFCRVNDEHGKETTDLDRLETIANANDVAPQRYGKLGVATNGWQGRFRMTIRNMLAPRVASKGFLFVPDGAGVDADQEFTAPDEWRAKHMPKQKPAKGDVAKPDAPSGKKGASKLAKEAGERGVTEATKAVRAARAKKQGVPA